MSYTKLFANTVISEAYHKFRPPYPIEVVDRIIKYLQEKHLSPLALAIDVGCGSGQSTRNLSPHFEKVIGCDVSETQIKKATETEKLANIEYRIGNDEALPAEDGSVDLVTAAQAAHWFNLKTFYSEVDRILKPGGCLALYGYGSAVEFHQNSNAGELQKVFDEFYYGTLKGYWEGRRKHIEDLYADIHLPYSDAVRDHSMAIEMEYTVSDFVGYLSSLSAFHEYKRLHPEEDTLQTVLEKFTRAFGKDAKSADHTTMNVSYPIFLLLGRKPNS
ncbi:putative methyltransferase DDB_G0268948 [Ptychodera flava]|uniref:putative methyltransferase DDB_G0268948 n=1 Tax=Ptychodera flava TaxID=63121 RepID=UPI00396A0FC0